MKLISDPRVKDIFNAYPIPMRDALLYLRELVLTSAKQIDGLDILEETLKWGEPSYLTKFGSTVRMDWKQKKPEQFAIYFKCTSLLVPTFKTIYNDKFNYENNRAIVFKLTDKIPDNELKHCISLALNYHKIKHIPLLGASEHGL